MSRVVRLPIDIGTVKGFLDTEEGEALYEAALKAAALGPLLEIGSYCGKSAVYLGTAARDAGSILFTIDHHRGSEEMQPGWAHLAAFHIFGSSLCSPATPAAAVYAVNAVILDVGNLTLPCYPFSSECSVITNFSKSNGSMVCYMYDKV